VPLIHYDSEYVYQYDSLIGIAGLVAYSLFLDIFLTPIYEFPSHIGSDAVRWQSTTFVAT